MGTGRAAFIRARALELANRPVIVTQSGLLKSALQFRGSPYSGANRRARTVLRTWCDACRASGLGARLWGTAQILLSGCLFPQLPEAAMAELLLHALSQFVRLTEKTAGSR